ncbi:DUF5020 family protein [Primorskyibacter flagellatus]|uniref:Nucleoside-specific outer membrane channel protein Tsx n=1 Tax=Primorskyibacter flagellatus TaxID=1387277 RepID=A0A1W2DXN9_9RHOB|nr:DUF5020 family protein [Primorskyibacter flagellatus]SMD02203.1 Nucleoside-specific outer membrane channel protein Tsx [Primorskyibacter flagellatus]
MKSRNEGLKALSVAAFSGLAGVAMPAAAGAEILFSTGEVQLHYGDGYHLGANGFDTTSRTTLTVEQFTLFNWGDLFYFVDLFQDHEGTGREVDHYAEIYAHLNGGNFGINFREDGFVKDVGLDFGLFHGTDFLVAAPGVRADFNVPGFNVFTFGLYAYDNLVDPFNRDLDMTYQATLVWNAPFTLGNANMSFRGFTDFIGDQGSGVDDQIVASPQLVWDVGQEGGASIGLEYTYFRNKFGVTGVDDNSISAFVALKF